MKYSEKVSEKLNELLEKNYDTEKNYRFAAENIRDSRLQEFFYERAQERYDFGHELKSEIRNYGEVPKEGSSIAGDARRTWMNLKTRFSSNKDETVLEEAIKGEKAAIEEYEEVLKDTSIPESTASILLKQKKALVAGLNKVNDLEAQR